MNKLKMSLFTCFIFWCVSVFGQTTYDQLSKDSIYTKHGDELWYAIGPVNNIHHAKVNYIKMHPDSIYFTIQGQVGAISKGQYIKDADFISEEGLRTLRKLNDSLQKKLDKFVTFYGYVCPIMDALHLTDENKFQFKRAELAKRYRMYLEYYEPEYIANARKRQRK